MLNKPTNYSFSAVSLQHILFGFIWLLQNMYVVLPVKLKIHTIMKFNVRIEPEKRKDKITGEIISERVPLFAHITYAGQRLFYFTGYRVNISNFNFEEKLVTKNASGWEGKRKVSYNLINNRIKSIKAQLELFFQNLDTAPSKAEVSDLLDKKCKKVSRVKNIEDELSFTSLLEKYLRLGKMSDIRKRNIRAALNHWFQFAEKRGFVIAFNAIDADRLRDFENYLKESEYDEVKKKTIKEALGRNTVHKIMVMTRAFWRFAIKEYKLKGKELHYPFGKESYVIDREVYGAPIYISKEERDKLHNLEISNERLSRVRDIFVFQCLVGARVGDLYKLTKDNITDGVLSYIARKTKDNKPVPATVPLGSKALEILKRYDLPDGRLLPFIAEPLYNSYIKELFNKAGLTRNVTRINPKTSEPEQVKLSDIASSHMARRTFIGMLYNTGYDRALIASMSGHKPDSKSFSRYHVVERALKEQAINAIN
jgi:integrase